MVLGTFRQAIHSGQPHFFTINLNQVHVDNGHVLPLQRVAVLTRVACPMHATVVNKDLACLKNCRRFSGEGGFDDVALMTAPGIYMQ